MNGGQARPHPVSMLPNIVSLLALGCSITAVRVAIDGHHLLVPLFLMGLAALLDGLDGRMARALDAESELGANLDSLCDVVGFGVVPPLILNFVVLQPQLGSSLSGKVSAIAWAASVVYLGAIVLRLARFNTMLTANEAPYQKYFFTGVPALATAWLVLVPIVAIAEFGRGWWSNPLVVSAWLVLNGCLAFSRIPTVAPKHLRISAQYVPTLLLAALAIIAGVLTFPLVTVLLVMGAYLLHIPVSAVVHHHLAKCYEARAPRAAEPAPPALSVA